MGGISGIDNDWELSFPSTGDVRTFVLVGRTGNGKSSTGNTILGKKAFTSKQSSGGVTITCEVENSVLENGQILNVIDTPGLFDASFKFEVIRNEIVKCVEMAKDGIHAVLVVLSVRTRFSREEESVIKSLREIFGTKISEYMIVVFTGGDDLENDGVTLDDYLGGRDCPETLKEMLKTCGGRCVLFDNRTNDVSKKSQQLKKLLSLVDVVIDNQSGKPFTNELFVEIKKLDCEMYGDLTDSSKLELSIFKEQLKKTYEEQLQSTNEMVELKLRETTYMIEKQLVEEQVARLKLEIAARDAQMQSEKDHAARLQLEIAAKDAQMKSDKEHAARLKSEIAAKDAQKKSDKEKANKEILKLREDFMRVERETQELKRKAEQGCSIL